MRREERVGGWEDVVFGGRVEEGRRGRRWDGGFCLVFERLGGVGVVVGMVLWLGWLLEGRGWKRESWVVDGFLAAGG